MPHRPVHQNGYTKKELIEIIEKIDADQSQMKNHRKEQNTKIKNNGSYFTGKYGETR